MPHHRRNETQLMTLQELSMEYAAQAELLHDRLALLRRQEVNAATEYDRIRIHDRVRILSAMWRDTRDIAALTAHYYERSHSRNANYIL